MTTNSENNEALLVPVKELCKLLNYSERTIWRLESTGALPTPIRLGRTVRWRLDEVKEWISCGCPNRREGS